MENNSKGNNNNKNSEQNWIFNDTLPLRRRILSMTKTEHMFRIHSTQFFCEENIKNEVVFQTQKKW